MDNAENVVTEIFKNEIQIKRITKELQLIEQLKKEEFKITLKTIQPNLQILVSLQNKQVQIPSINQLNSERPILLAIYIDNRFPFVFPKVHFLSHVTKPTMADGRDYLDDIIHQQWSPSILLHEIIKSFPKFLETIRINQNSREYIQSLGKYQIDHEYDANIGLEDAEYYQCKEIINGKQLQRTLQLTNSFILILEIQNQELILLTSIPTSDILQVEKAQQNSVKLTWRNGEGNQRISQFISSNQEQLFNSFLFCKSGSSGRKIHEEDVTMQKFAAYQIEELLVQVNHNEEELQLNLNKGSLNKLLELYQQAIEYYSAYSDEEYKQYVTRLQKLLGRTDVQQVLASPVK